VVSPAIAAVAAAAFLGSGPAPHAAPPPVPAKELRGYLARVEPTRHEVNALLDRADPILARYRDHRLGPRGARLRIESLEDRFSTYEARIAAVRPVPAALAGTHRAYAHAYVLEDAYLRALTAAIPRRRFGSLPRTEAVQRAAIIAWRKRLVALAAAAGFSLPPDVKIAGRGEIAPSPSAS
jgi:hypothetical protein